MNVNDADRVRTLLLQIGWEEAAEMLEADIVIFVTCSIRQHAEDRVWGLIRNVKKHAAQHNKNSIVGVTGCMVRQTSSRITPRQEQDKLLKQSDRIDFVFRIKEAPQLPQLMKEFFPIPEEFLDNEFENIFDAMPTQKVKHAAFVPISSGCDHFCTYCIVPYTRGKEECLKREHILKECRELIDQGAKEITLLGQNVNRYYFGERQVNPYRTDFAELLDQVAKLDHLQWLRYTSPHPQHLGEDVLEVMASNSNICRHLHLPVQAGNDQVLRRMARGYTVEQFRKTLAKARKMMPDIAITTDIIVGFPGETEEQFQDTLELCRAESFDKIFIGKYSPRPNTPAAKWDNISLEEKKRRYYELNELLKETSAHNLRQDIGQIKQVLIDRVDSETRIATGRTTQNRTVDVQVGQESERFVGQFVEVEITSSKTFLLEGKLMIQ